MRCLLNCLLTLGALSQYRSALAAPPSNTTPSANGSPSLGAPLPPEGHPDISLQLRSIDRARFESGKVIHNCLHVMVAGWMTDQPYAIGLPVQLVDGLKAWSQAVRVTPATERTTMLTSQLLAYAAGDIIDDLWWRYSEDATVFHVYPYRIVDKAGGRAIGDWDFVQLPPTGDEISSNSSHDIPIQYISNDNSSSDDQAAVAVTKRQNTAGDISSTNTTTDNDDNDDDHLPLTLPTTSSTADPAILVRLRFFSGQRLGPKSLLVLPAQLLRTVIFRYPPRAKVNDYGFESSASWTVSRLSYTKRHCLRLTLREASVEWQDLGSAVLALIPPPTEQRRWDAFEAEFTLRKDGVNFARVEAWEGAVGAEAGGGSEDGGCDGGVMG